MLLCAAPRSCRNHRSQQLKPKRKQMDQACRECRSAHAYSCYPFLWPTLRTLHAWQTQFPSSTWSSMRVLRRMQGRPGDTRCEDGSTSCHVRLVDTSTSRACGSRLHSCAASKQAADAAGACGPSRSAKRLSWPSAYCSKEHVAKGMFGLLLKAQAYLLLQHISANRPRRTPIALQATRRDPLVAALGSEMKDGRPPTQSAACCLPA